MTTMTFLLSESLKKKRWKWLVRRVRKILAGGKEKKIITEALSTKQKSTTKNL